MKAWISNISFAPAYGGPAVSVPRLARALSDMGAKVGLWAPDGSAKDALGLRASTGMEAFGGDWKSALAAFGEPDIIHDNGLWRPHNHGLAAYAQAHRIPRVVSPRGMLEPSAFAHKRIKKRLAWTTYQRHDLAMAQSVHVTSDREALNLTRFGLDLATATIPNGVDIPSPSRPTDACHEGRRTVLFLSRVHPLKGLPMLIEAWSTVRPRNWRLHIAGPNEDGHADDIAKLARERGLSEDEVTIAGPAYGDQKDALLTQAGLFVLPTYTESFGMAVAEALAYGTPVLTTTGAPWSGIVTEQCGWWVAPNTDAVAHALRDALGMSEQELNTMGERGRAWMARDFGWDRVANQCLNLYTALMAPPAR